jgi:hypothetical protein
MKKEIIQGIPFWVDKDRRIFAFEGKELPADPLWLGTCDAGLTKIELRADWQTAYQEKLEKYRQSATARPRVTS